jgi:(heptosyl)LPS beta-1,4-glucosyltransferase
MSITAVVITKNEEDKIRSCLNSLKGWIDEIVVVDDDSTDQTARIAVDEFKAKVIRHPLGGDFARQRDIGMQAASSEWILQLDADEVVPSESAERIKDAIVRHPDYNGFRILRKDCVFDKPLEYLGSRAQLRLVKKGRGSHQGAIHEELVAPEPVGEIAGAFILHYNLPSIRSFIDKNNFYTELEAQAYLDKTDSIEFKFLKKKILYKTVTLFFKHYFKNKAYKNGVHGFIRAVLNTMHPLFFWLKVLEKALKQNKLK